MKKTKIIEAVRARGNNARDLRDAAHEAYHALFAEADDWEREAVHDALSWKLSGAEMWAHELEARAIERIVCERLGEDYGDPEGWLLNSSMEAIKHRLPHGPWEASASILKQLYADPNMHEWAEKIIALGADPN